MRFLSTRWHLLSVLGIPWNPWIPGHPWEYVEFKWVPCVIHSSPWESILISWISMKPYEFIRILGICFGIPGSTLELLEIRWNSCGALEILQDNLSFLNFPGLPMNMLEFPNNPRNSLGFHESPCNPLEPLAIPWDPFNPLRSFEILCTQLLGEGVWVQGPDRRPTVPRPWEWLVRGFGSACESVWSIGLVFWGSYGPLFSVLFLGHPKGLSLKATRESNISLVLLWISLVFLSMSLVFLRISLFSAPLDILHFSLNYLNCSVDFLSFSSDGLRCYWVSFFVFGYP